jgi:predicted nuclease of restriction endonuclease-like RecB superfamily
MLPLQLLRIKIKNKGKNIAPIFCEYPENNNAGGSELELATKIIEEFEKTWKNKEKKGVLEERVTMLESQYSDYKLVRGFYVLLERRCVFNISVKNTIAGISADMTSNTTATFGTNATTTSSSSITSVIHHHHQPFNIRRELFEESSKRGYALTDSERKQIMDAVASRLGLPTQDMAEFMWSDQEENMILSHFHKITADQLIGYYNLSLMQTLLFNCTKLEFSIHSGSNWKRVLREVKRLGLMYSLQQQKEEDEQKSNNMLNNDQDIADHEVAVKNNTNVVCSIDGPLSLFKLTDRYGTAIAKLLPSIVSTERWSFKAWIVRKTMSAGKKIYEFEMSSKESPLLQDPHNYVEVRISNGKTGFPNQSYSNVYFDSSVEEKFANKFEQSATGWKLIREPDPLILSNGKALIPDFMFEKYDRRIYLEIVGFWTKEYLERKLHKINDISTAHNKNNKIDFFIAINDDYYTIPTSNSIINQRRRSDNLKSLSTLIDKNHLIPYKNDNVPLRALLEYLKSIELDMIEKYANHNHSNLLTDLDNIINTNASKGIISINEIAKKYNIPTESALKIIKSDQEKADENNYNNNRYIIADKFLILQSKANELKLHLTEINRFDDACLILSKNNIPESSHAALLSKLGFEVIWKGIDSSSAIIERRKC